MDLTRPETIEGYSTCCKSCRAWVRASLKRDGNSLASNRKKALEFVSLCGDPDMNCEKD